MHISDELNCKPSVKICRKCNGENESSPRYSGEFFPDFWDLCNPAGDVFYHHETVPYSLFVKSPMVTQ